MYILYILWCTIYISCDVYSMILWRIFYNRVMFYYMKIFAFWVIWCNCVLDSMDYFRWLEIINASSGASWEYWQNYPWEHENKTFQFYTFLDLQIHVHCKHIISCRKYSAIIGNSWIVTIWMLLLLLTNSPSFRRTPLQWIIQNAIITHTSQVYRILHQMFESIIVYISQDIQHTPQDIAHMYRHIEYISQDFQIKQHFTRKYKMKKSYYIGIWFILQKINLLIFYKKNFL